MGGGGWIKVIFVSHPTFELSWGCDNFQMGVGGSVDNADAEAESQLYVSPPFKGLCNTCMEIH